SLFRRPDDHVERLALFLDLAFAGGPEGGDGERARLGTGEAGPPRGAGDEAIQYGFQAVMRSLVDVVGLSGGEEDAVDLPADQPADRIAVALPEAGEDLGQRRLQVGHGGRAGIEGAERVDEHYLPVQPSK